MRTENVKSNSFKGTYLLKGNTEVLDEICWYMQRKQKNPANAFGFIDIRNGFLVPPQILKADDKLDLFITGADKKIIEPKMDGILYETLEKNIATLPLTKKIKFLLDRLTAMRESVSHGKPIEGLNKYIVTDYMKDNLNIEKIKLLEAEDAFNGIQKGSFDITDGLVTKG